MGFVGGGLCDFSAIPSPNWTLGFGTSWALGLGLGLGWMDLGLLLFNITCVSYFCRTNFLYFGKITFFITHVYDVYSFHYYVVKTWIVVYVTIFVLIILDDSIKCGNWHFSIISHLSSRKSIQSATHKHIKYIKIIVFYKQYTIKSCSQQTPKSPQSRLVRKAIFIIDNEIVLSEKSNSHKALHYLECLILKRKQF